MRSAVSWVLVMAGLLIGGTGIDHAGSAWWSQRTASEATRVEPTARFVPPPGFVAQLTIPRLETSLYVVDAKSHRDLRRGPGYIAGSSRPGLQGNTIIAGHRDLHFRVLNHIRIGDEIEIRSQQGHFIYRVASVEIVSPTDVSALREVYPQQLTLVTCYPFYYLGPAPKRFIVKARLQ